MVPSVPLPAIGALPAAEITGKIVIDICNYYHTRDDRNAKVDDGKVVTSAAGPAATFGRARR